MASWRLKLKDWQPTEPLLATARAHAPDYTGWWAPGSNYWKCKFYYRRQQINSKTCNTSPGTMNVNTRMEATEANDANHKRKTLHAVEDVTRAQEHYTTSWRLSKCYCPFVTSIICLARNRTDSYRKIYPGDAESQQSRPNQRAVCFIDTADISKHVFNASDITYFLVAMDVQHSAFSKKKLNLNIPESPHCHLHFFCAQMTVSRLLV